MHIFRNHETYLKTNTSFRREVFMCFFCTLVTSCLAESQSCLRNRQIHKWIRIKKIDNSSITPKITGSYNKNLIGSSNVAIICPERH